ncbi:MAG TPA: cupin domain-containing protein [Bryobacterales bacterium]|nr:cupin domain-containing protein [Bryobacterales bacterium]
MKTLMAVLASVVLAGAALAQDTLASRIAHTDPSKYRAAPRVHGGAGELDFFGLFGANVFTTNVIFLHRGVLPPGGGIGHHFHHQCEEMFVIFDNAAQFTIDGRTSVLQGPAGAPCRMGHSHAIYNHTDKPTQWMNINVGSVHGRYDNEDLGDDRVGAPLDPKPVFSTMRLDPKLLRPVEALHGGRGTARYRRALRSEMFHSNWEYVDHLILPPDTSDGLHRHDYMEEFYYVNSGRGRVTVDKENAAIGPGDAVPIRLGEAHSFYNPNSQELELMIVGVSLEKGKLDVTELRGGAGQARR